MQTGSSGTLIGWKSGQTTFVPLWDGMEGAWLLTQKEIIRVSAPSTKPSAGRYQKVNRFVHIREVLGNKYAEKHDLKTVQIREN